MINVKKNKNQFNKKPTDIYNSGRVLTKKLCEFVTKIKFYIQRDCFVDVLLEFDQIWK